MINNGPVNMYRTQPIVQHDFSVELPSCMYKVKNIHQTRRNCNVIKTPNHVYAEKKKLDISDQVKQFLKKYQDNPEMTELVKRQQKILQQLEELKGQMLNIRRELNVDKQESSCDKKSNILNHKVINENVDVILNANPSNPPYSLLLLSKLLKDKVKLNVATHVHSSIKMKENLKFLEIPSVTAQSDVPEINLKLIWKDVGVHTIMITSECAQIIGEVNMLRYLARKISFLNYENSNLFEIDSLLDTCHCLVSAPLKMERSSLLRLFNKKTECGNGQVSIADLAIYSAIKQISKSELSSNLIKLLVKYESL